MENIRIQSRRGRRKTVSFNPNRQYVSESVQEFLNKGGKITRIKSIERSYTDFVALTDSQASVDDFLMGT